MKAKLNRRGAIAAVTAVVMIPVVGFAGLAIDLTRIWMVNARLKTAVDAASLIAARTITSPNRDADTRALFWANFNQNGRSPNFMGSAVIVSTPPQPEITPVPGSDTRIRVTATARLNTTLFSVIDRHQTTLRETTVAERGGTGIELAIVLDQTSSMRLAADIGGTKLEAAQAAVGTLLRQIYGDTADTARNVYVSVVPFSRTVNIGTGNRSFLDTSNMPPGWDVNNWGGCVEARRGGQDITEASPTAAPFRPYFYPNTYRRVGWATVTTGGRNPVTTSPTNAVLTADPRNANLWRTATGTAPYQGAGVCSTGNAYATQTVNLYATSGASSTTPYTVNFCRGDNDFGNTALSRSTSDANYNASYATLYSAGFRGIGYEPTAAAGPNILCARSPILPLTASRGTVMNAVNAIVAPERSGGTTAVTGMQGAWYTLSPEWRDLWPGISTSDDHGRLPLAYGTRNMFKAVLILTDGDNNWQTFYGGTAVRGSPTATELLYNAYGRVGDNALPPDDITNWNSDFPDVTQISPVNQTRADARLDERFAEICRAMKGDNHASVIPTQHRIRIYVVGFEIRNPSSGSATAVEDMLKTCASTRERPYFIEAESAADLNDAFTEVGNALSSLRMIE